MCNIAGYVGIRPAAPILIEMIRRQEGLAGGYYTGLATIHEGRIHYVKLTGDVDRLLAETDALSLPGTIGIIHSRSKAGGGDEWAHPFVDAARGEPVADENAVGRLIYFFEKACAISGYMLGVNPFNQPGVEEYKKNMFALLGKPGYEDQKAELEKRLGK